LDTAASPKQPDLLRNMLLNLGGRGILTLLALAVTPVLVRRLGTDVYGIYVLAFTLGGALSILDVGLTPALILLLSRAWHANDRPEIERILGTALATYFIAGALLAGVVALLVPWLTVSLLHVPPRLQSEAEIALWLSTASFLVALLFSVFNSIPTALERFDLVVLRTVGVQLLTTAAVVIYVLAGGGLVGVVVINLLGNVAALAMYVAVGRHLLPGVRISPAIDLATAKAIGRFSAFKFSGALGSLATNRFDQVAIGAFMGVRSAGVYLVPVTAAARILQLLTDLMIPLFPRISKLADEPATIQSLLLRAARLMALVAAPTFVLLFVFADTTIRAWIGGEEGRVLAIEGAATLRWLAAATFIQALAVVPIVVSEAMGRPEVNNGFAVLSAFINVPLVLLLVPRLGIEGAAIAFFINNVTQTVLFIFYASRRFAEVRPGQLIRESLLRPLAAAIVIGVVAWQLRPLVHGAVSLVVAVIGLMVLYAVVVRIVSAVTKDDLDYLEPFVRRLPRPLHRAFSFYAE
jgi:O-antigen/teichoic acid export membrane protein